MAKKKEYNYPLRIDRSKVNLAALKKLAKINGRSFNAEINEALAKYLQQSLIHQQ